MEHAYFVVNNMMRIGGVGKKLNISHRHIFNDNAYKMIEMVRSPSKFNALNGFKLNKMKKKFFVK